MKLISKAYSCRPNWSDDQSGDIVQAITRGQAKSNFIKILEDFEINFTEIVAVRMPDYDLFENTPHPILATLTKSQIDKMQHTAGLNYKLEPFRNYYFLSKECSELEELVDKGLMEKSDRQDKHIYHLTELGMDVIMTTKPINRKKLLNRPFFRTTFSRINKMDAFF